MSKKVILFNPRSATAKYRVPNSVLSLAASINIQYEWVIVDGNREANPYQKISNYLDSGEYNVLGVTVMPGPQLKEAIPISKKVKKEYPSTKIIWGGYFASNQKRTVIQSDYVDFVVSGVGEKAFPQLLDSINNNTPVTEIENLVYMEDGELKMTHTVAINDPDSLNKLPYDKLDDMYSLKSYLGPTFLGRHTLAYHSSFGCPFTCSFCAVVPLYNARWKGLSAGLIYSDIIYVKEKYGADAIEFHDNNFFVSEKRVREFSALMLNENMNWWGEGRN